MLETKNSFMKKMCLSLLALGLASSNGLFAADAAPPAKPPATKPADLFPDCADVIVSAAFFSPCLACVSR